MVSPLVDEIWQVLVAGVQVSELESQLRERRPNARDIATKLTTFLNRLWMAGLLEGSAPCEAPRPRRIEIPVDRLALAFASVLRRIPLPLLVGVILAFASAACCGLLLLLLSPGHPRMRELPEHLNVAGVLFILVALIPLHEIGHAVACRFFGFASGPAVISLGRFGIPRLFVATPYAWEIEQPGRRCWVPAGGPLVDLLAGGFASWGILAFDVPTAIKSVLWLVALYELIVLNVGTSPIPVGDGSHFLEALLGDEFARGAALFRRYHRFVRPRSTRIYRIVSIGHVLGSTVLMFLLLRS
jgi:hypothetical protein